MTVLSHEELAALGVSTVDSKYGRYYSIPCAICGLPVKSRTFSVNRAYRCKVCKNDLAKKRKAINKAEKEQADRLLASELGVDVKHMRRFDKGAAKFGKAYAKNVETARKAIEDYDSVPEVVACIELLHTGTRVIVHQPVGDFTVDFCLPVEKLAVEIDGSLYHKDENKKYMRDYAIKYMLGDGWEVRHIPADSVMSNHALFGCNMKRLLNARRKEFGVQTI